MMLSPKLSVGLVFVALLTGVLHYKWDPLVSAVDQTVHGPFSVEQRVSEYGDVVESRLKPDFAKAGVAYPPEKLTLVVLKEEKQVELYAGDAKTDTLKFIRTYPIHAASGHLGPKLREGDWQVPEGIYGVESLNPNSHYHLALHVDYPNAFDRAKAKLEGRTDLGGDIMIHGDDVSIGCVAMGDETAEDLFILAARVGSKKVRLLFCPVDFRQTKISTAETDSPKWLPELYASLERNLSELPLPPHSPESGG